ncbi:MAG: UpxY family transcription antiterminator [Terracidiphilus sp.]|jgi:transcription antitermination factor NusG
MIPTPIEMWNSSNGNATDDRSNAALCVETRRHWYALYTASNHEKIIDQRLRQKEVETFLPLHTVTKRWKNRTTVKLDVPLFGSYVFVKITMAESAKVLSIPRVFSIVGNGRRPLPLSDSEIETLRKGLKTLNVVPWPNIKVGTRAQIKSGPLAGLEGIVIRSDSQLRVVLSIDMISKSIAVHVCAEDIETRGDLEEIAPESKSIFA